MPTSLIGRLFLSFVGAVVVLTIVAVSVPSLRHRLHQRVVYAVDDNLHAGGWKDADLDRNRLDLEMFSLRQAADGPDLLTHEFHGRDLVGSVRYGTVVASGGSARLRHGGDLYVVVRYTFEPNGQEVDPDNYDECWRFTTPDGYDVTFEQVDCP